MTPPQKVKQWLTGQDGLDKLRMDEVDCPTPGEDEVLIEVHSVSLNYRDTEGMLQLFTTTIYRNLWIEMNDADHVP